MVRVDLTGLNVSGYTIYPYQKPTIPKEVVVSKMVQLGWTGSHLTWMQDLALPPGRDTMVLTIPSGKKRHYAPKKRKRRLKRKIAKMIREFHGNIYSVDVDPAGANVQFSYTKE